MSFSPNFERLQRAVKHQEADRVPFCEPDIGYGIQSQFLGREVRPDDIPSQIEFFQKAGYDYVPVAVSLMRPGKVTEESKITRILRQMVLEKNPEETNSDAWNLEYTSFIHEKEDFLKFPWDALEEIDFSLMNQVTGNLPDGMKAIVLSGKIFTLSWMLMGFNNFNLQLVMNPQLCKDVINAISKIQIKALETILNKDEVGAVWIVDDIAYGTGPMISPTMLNDFLFPWYKKIADLCHESGKFVIHHSDGNMRKLLPYLIDIGIDMSHPVDPTCMDIFQTKKDFGDKIAICGNVPNEMLRNGTREEVKEYTLKLIKACAPGGGYCMASGNSVPDWSNFDNYKTMLETTLSHGYYDSLAE
ncbi:MAG: uroporphyrinogen decarboxylase family protein [Desulfobacterium sp.]